MHALAPRALALCLAAGALSGCAAAIPLVAGGAVLARKDVGKALDQAGQDNDAAAEESTPDLMPDDVNAPVEIDKADTPAEIVSTPDTAEPTEPAPIASVEIDASTAPVTELDELPDADTAPVSRGQSFADLQALMAFYTYAEAQASGDPIDDGRQSALLAQPSLLKPDRTDCSIRPPAVLIDLDPQDGVLDLKSASIANATLGQLLAELRGQEVAVFWISSLSAAYAPELRRRLRETALDSDGEDDLLLIRRPEDRKQLRRAELGETHCLVAIAGDTRSDFDELFAYLKDPAKAGAVEVLLGKGWFLTPLPLTPPPTADMPTEDQTSSEKG